MNIRTKTVRMSRSSQINKAVGINAVAIAKRRKDPLIKKLEKYRKLYMTIKEQIQRKYAARGKMAVRKKMAKR